MTVMTLSQVAEVLLHYGGEATGINVGNYRKNTPLHAAATNGYTPIVKLLVRNGADIHAENEDGDTPLHTSCHFGHADAAELLVKKGADMVRIYLFAGCHSIIDCGRYD